MATVAATPRHHPRITAHPVVLAAICLAAAGFITYMVLEVPVAAPLPHGHVLLFCPIAPLPLPHAQISGHWPLAVVAGAVVLAVDAAALTVMRRRRARRDSPSGSAPAAAASRPSPLRLERVPVRAVAIAGAASLTLLIAGFSQRYAMWLPVGVALLPWIPLLAAEAIWKYGHYGLWAIFGVAVLLQVGHMGEHTVQVTQLLIGSPLARPYLHFAYNFLVVVPMVCAFLDQTKHVYDRRAEGSPTIPGTGVLQSPAGAIV